MSEARRRVLPMTPDEHYDDLDSLEIVELTMELEALMGGEAMAPEERARRIREIRARLKHFDLGEFGEFEEGGDDDDPPAALVRKLPPRGPLGRSGVAVRPEGH